MFFSVAEIGFVRTWYSVTEPESSKVEVMVCINITNEQSLHHGDGFATINIMTSNSSATG